MRGAFFVVVDKLNVNMINYLRGRYFNNEGAGQLVWCIRCGSMCGEAKAFPNGFHFVNGVKVSAGMCGVRRAETATGDAQEECARMERQEACKAIAGK
jgi:hypothetical protein